MRASTSTSGPALPLVGATPRASRSSRAPRDPGRAGRRVRRPLGPDPQAAGAAPVNHVPVDLSPAIGLAALVASPDGIVVTDAGVDDRPALWVNDAFTSLTGWSAAEIVGRNTQFLVAPSSRPEEVARLLEAIATGTR